MAKIIEKKFLLDGYVYLRSRATKNRVYWDCRQIRTDDCAARAITNNSVAGTDVIVYKGTKLSEHAHPRNQEECAAEVDVDNMKRKAKEHPQLPPAQILRTELQGVSCSVLSQLPEQEALKKLLRKE